MTVLGEQRRARWLTTSLVSALLLSWAATVYVFVLVADGLSDKNSHTDWWAHVIALALIAVTIAPLRRWLRLRVDDVVYGHYDDGYSVITRLNRQIDAPAPAVSDGDPSVAEMLARTMNVPYVAITQGESVTSVAGERPTDRDLTDVPLTYRGELIGRLQVAPRHPGTDLAPRDLKLLADLAQQLGVGMYAVRASEQLQASRASLVTAREEERRRIRRDLHDGLGPTLASLKLQLTAVQRLLGPEPDRAAAMLDEVRDSMNQTTAEIRRLVYGLRPPLLDELGLVASLRNHPAAQGDLLVTVTPDELPELPAAVEVALYRIAAEAVHNAAKHSGGARCDVAIEVLADEARLTVSDDGRGLPVPMIDGVGVMAMKERAEELGGTVTLMNNPGTGAAITTVIPLGKSGPR